MDIHLRDLRYFVPVAEEGHVTRAAELLYVSQPSLSKQLRSLERQLGFPLFERHARGVTLTPAGSSLLPRAQALIAEWDEAFVRARDAAGAPGLVIGMQTAVGRDVQRHALDEFRRRQPGVTVSLRLVGWNDPTGGLGDHSSDVAFLWLPAPEEALETLTIATEPRLVAFPSDSDLAELDEVDFDRIADLPFIALPEDAGPLRDWWLAMDERQRPPVIGGVADSADEAMEMVASGAGVVLLAAGNAALYPRPGVSTRPVRGLSPAVLVLAWRARDTRLEVQDFIRALASAIATRRA